MGSTRVIFSVAPFRWGPNDLCVHDDCPSFVDDGTVELTDADGSVLLSGNLSYEKAQRLARSIENGRVSVLFSMAKTLLAAKGKGGEEKAPAKSEEKSQSEMASIIVERLENLSGDYHHTTEDIQMWVLGRTIEGEETGLRSKLDRARAEAHEVVGQKLNGHFSKAGKVGRMMTYKFREGPAHRLEGL